MKEIYQALQEIKADGKAATLATIVRTRGSTPREVGTKMVVREDGKFFGTIGGGCGEAEVWAEAMHVLRKTKRPRLMSVDLTEDTAMDEGMICGGIMDVFIEPVLPDPQE